jgi:low temperature requirement protein LtrA
MDSRDELLQRRPIPPTAVPIELFLDLVFVFSFTQLSGLLTGELTAAGALRVLVLLLAVWWAWLYTAWGTSLVDPRTRPIRLLLLAISGGSLLMAVAIPGAYHEQAVVFVGAYVVIQLGRAVYLQFAVRSRAGLAANLRRAAAWFALSGVIWLAGALLGGGTQVVIWLLAVAVDYTAPLVGFYLPGRGRAPARAWAVEGAHLAERCQNMILLALGESILVIGATTVSRGITAANSLTLGLAFLSSAVLWWIYFDRGAEAGARAISKTVDPASSQVALLAYDVVHIVMIAGIIVAAVGDRLTIAHPAHHASWSEASTILGGPALYLLGITLFDWSLTSRSPRSRIVAIAVLAGLAPLTLAGVEVLVLSVTATVVLIIVAWLGTQRPPYASEEPGPRRRK